MTLSEMYRDSVRKVVSPRENELNINNFCEGFLWDLMSLSEGRIDLSEARNAYTDLEDFRDQQGIVDDEPDSLYWEIDTILSGDREILDHVDSGKLEGESIEDYFKTVYDYSRYFVESNSGYLNDAMAFYLNEELENFKKESMSISERFHISEKDIRVDTRDKVLMQIPMSSNPEDVVQVILVEYANPNTLTGISKTTKMCVGEDTMHYKDYLKSGRQRHFGILAQKSDGTLYVMYHTHVSGSTIHQFTNVRNNQAEINRFPQQHHEILNAAKRKIQEVIQ